MDGGGRVWTPAESKPCRSGPCGLVWTPVDGAWRSTDQKVGDSSSSGRAAETLALPCRGFVASGPTRDGISAGRIWMESSSQFEAYRSSGERLGTGRWFARRIAGWTGQGALQ